MSKQHPVIAVTGSSGAGTTTVKTAFEHIFRRLEVNAAIVEGDSFHRFDRAEMKVAMAEAAKEHRTLSHFGANANRYLAAYGRKIGPDPASIGAAMIGGIVANNASGMCCGTAENSYQTLASMRLVLADGTLVEAASADLPAWGNVQLNGVFGAEAPVEGGYIDVWTETEGAAFTAYGSVLDNTTSDPTTVLPQ